MGQAKARGTFEQRKAEAVVKNAKLEAIRQAEYDARVAERKAARQRVVRTRRGKNRLSTLVALAAASGMGHYPI